MPAPTPPADFVPVTPPPATLPYPPTGDADLRALLAFTRQTPFAYGSWRGWKALYKAVEADPSASPVLAGALAGRINLAPRRGVGDANPVMEIKGFRRLSGIAARDRYLYVLGAKTGWSGPADTLAIFNSDTSGGDPLKPKSVASVKVDGGRSITLCGPLACLLPFNEYNEAGPLLVYDMSDARDPRLRASVDMDGLVRGAASAFPYLYASVEKASGRGAARGFGALRAAAAAIGIGAGAGNQPFNGLRVLDLANPDQPQIAGEVVIEGAGAVAVDGALAGVLVTRGNGMGGRKGGLRVVDVSDPARPRVVGALDLGDVKSVALANGFAYVTTGYVARHESFALHVIDLSNPANPRRVGGVELDSVSEARPIILDNHVCLTLNYQGVAVVDVNAPAAPHVVSRIGGGSYTTEFAISGRMGYDLRSASGVGVLDLTRAGKPARVGAPPTPETFEYMKRRARRLLRTLAKTDEARYVAVAAQTLAEYEALKSTQLDPGAHWLTYDILFAGSKRFTQSSHGRGGYPERFPVVVADGAPSTTSATPPLPRLRRRTREERAPGAWDRNPQAARSLLGLAHLPWQIHEFAARVTLAAHLPMPVVPADALLSWLGSGSAVLTPLASRVVADRMTTGDAAINGALAAQAFVRAAPPVRARIKAALDAYAARDSAANGSWVKEFAAGLAALISELSGAASDGALGRRARHAADLLARRFPDTLTASDVTALAPSFLQTGRDDLRDLLVSVAGRAQIGDVLNWLQALNGTGENERARVVDALARAVGGLIFPPRDASLLVNHPLPFVRESAWRLLAASQTPGATLAPLWDALFALGYETPALATAMGSPDALALLERAGVTADDLGARLEAQPFLVALLSPDAFARVAQTAPAPLLLRLIAAAPDEQWARFRPGLLRNLREGVGLAELWMALPAALQNDVNDRLGSRLVEDDEISQTFGDIEGDEPLAIREPAFDTLLARWAVRNEARFERGSALLLDAAIHPLPGVRAWALTRVRTVGMELPFALRLLESEVPPSAQVGKMFFEAVPHGGDREQRDALALCDSPCASVRAYGLEYVAARWETLPHAPLLRALFENSDPVVQAFVAERLGEATAPASSGDVAEKPADLAGIASDAAQFDAEVLRTTNRSRRAKEKIKSRQTGEQTISTEALLTLARGRTPRDADWAMGELARRALAGETIEGMSVDANAVTGI